jgi:sensor domain CHASE-containing protein
MGKKTLEDIAKLILMSFITFILTTVGVKRTMLDSKMDRMEYEKDQEQRWNAHDQVQKKNDERNQETHDMVKFLYENEISKSN